ncbi:MAG: hypothetical protein GQ523_09935 [Methanophagales archaeon]|nr:hypothetical protein [Methanophagales archaeon]
MAKDVESYQVGWKHDGKYGIIVLFFEGGESHKIDYLSYEDYSAMVDMLRNEKPVWYDENRALLATYKEPVGEEET